MSRENILRVLEDENPVPLSMEEVRVIEAVSPTVDLERVGNETHMTVRDLRGLHSAVIYDGEKGDTGEKGDKGDRGEKGEKGDTGAQGIQGEQGIQGVPGEKGEKGDTGEKGATGERGEKGDTGAQGAQGIPGVSPTVTVTDITGGHRVTITDAEHPQGISFDVMDGSDADAPVQDVTVGGSSVVGTDGVAKIPIAGTDLGAVKENLVYGIDITGAGQLLLIQPTDTEIKRGYAGNRRAIMTIDQHKATFYGLSKVAGVDLANETVTLGTYPDAAKSAIHEMLSGSISVTGTTPTINALPGLRYICGECLTLTVNLPASGCVDVQFESGSTPTVLTIVSASGQTLKWANGFDPDTLDADTTYEINIADGLGVAGSW